MKIISLVLWSSSNWKDVSHYLSDEKFCNKGPPSCIFVLHPLPCDFCSWWREELSYNWKCFPHYWPLEWQKWLYLGRLKKTYTKPQPTNHMHVCWRISIRKLPLCVSSMYCWPSGVNKSLRWCRTVSYLRDAELICSGSFVLVHFNANHSAPHHLPVTVSHCRANLCWVRKGQKHNYSSHIWMRSSICMSLALHCCFQCQCTSCRVESFSEVLCKGFLMGSFTASLPAFLWEHKMIWAGNV